MNDNATMQKESSAKTNIVKAYAAPTAAIKALQQAPRNVSGPDLGKALNAMNARNLKDPVIQAGSRSAKEKDVQSLWKDLMDAQEKATAKKVLETSKGIKTPPPRRGADPNAKINKKDSINALLKDIKRKASETKSRESDLLAGAQFRLGGLRGPGAKDNKASMDFVRSKKKEYAELLEKAGVPPRKADKMVKDIVETKMQGRHLRKRVAIPSAAVGTGAAGYAVTSPSADMAEQLISEDKPLPELRSGSETSTKPSPTAQIKEKGTEALNKIKSILSTQGGHAGLGALLGGLGTYGVSSAMDEEDMTEEELAERRKKKAIYSILGALGGAGIGAGVHHLRNKQASAEKQELLGLIQKEASEMSTEELEDAILLNKSIYTRLSKEASDNKHVMKMQLSACVKSGLI